jgi:hypothetical protein
MGYILHFNRRKKNQSLFVNLECDEYLKQNRLKFDKKSVIKAL